MEEQSMKKSIGKKLLAGIVSVSMILGIPVAGYSQEEDLQAVIVSEEAGQMTEEVLAGVGETEETVAEAAVQEPAAEETSEAEVLENVIPDEAAGDTEAVEEEIIIAAQEDETEEVPEDGILLEEEMLEAADGETPAPIHVDSEEKLINAIGQVTDGGTIILDDNITTTGAISMDNEDLHMLSATKSVTIDLNDRTLLVASGYGFYVKAEKTLTLTNGTFNGSLCVDGGTVNLPSDVTLTGAMCMRATKGGTINMNGASVISSETGSAAQAVEIEKGTLNLAKGSLKVTVNSRRGIVLNDADAVVKMTSGNIEVDGDGTAVAMSKGKMTVSDGTCTIKSTAGKGVEVDGGSFTLSKGIIFSKKDAVTLCKNDGKTAVITIEGKQDTTRVISEDGYAVYEKESDNNGSITIKGGYLEATSKTQDIYHANYDKQGSRTVPVVTEDVGFCHDVERIYLPNDNCRTKDDDGDQIYTILQLTESNAAAAYIRPNGDVFYTETLQEAMTVLGKTYSPKTGDTVKLFKDITPDTTDESTITVAIDRTIDLNGHLLKTMMTVSGCTVTVKNGTLQSYSDDYAFVTGEEADVTLDPSLTVKSPGKYAVSIGGDSSKTYKLTVKCKVEAYTYALTVNPGNCTLNIDSATITSRAQGFGVMRVDPGATGAKIKITNSILTGSCGVYVAAGEVTISGCTISGTGDQEGNPAPGTTGMGSAVWIKNAKVTIDSGTFTSAKGHALYLDTPTASSEISGGTFRSDKPDWDAVAGKPAAGMFTGGTYYPNTKNAMKAGVDTSKNALVGVTGGTFYVGAYDKVVPVLYAANPSAANLTVGAAAKSTLLYGFAAHAAILNLTTEDIDVLIGTDNTIAKNKGTLPKTADKEAWVFHNDLVELKASVNKEPTCTLPAVSADCWYCETLQKAYKAADAKEEADPGTITKPAKGHTWGEWNANGDRTCSVCGAKEHDDSKVQPPAPAYQISGRPTKVTAKAAGSRKLTVSWKMPTKSKLKKIKGYYIEVATDRNFTNIVRTRKVKKAKTSYTFKKLQKGTRYFVRVRFYKGTNISRWSAVKKRKVK